jgi:hypothetical protein
MVVHPIVYEYFYNKQGIVYDNIFYKQGIVCVIYVYLYYKMLILLICLNAKY